MTSIKDLNDDVLKHILDYTEQTIIQKIDEIETITELNKAMNYMKRRQGELRLTFSNVMRKNLVFRLKFNYKNQIVEGLFLIQSAFLNKKQDTINITEVIPSLVKRIFGYYEIIKTSIFIKSSDLIEYELLYEHTEPEFIENKYYGTMSISSNYIHTNEYITLSNKVILGKIVSISKNKVHLSIDWHQIDDIFSLNDNRIIIHNKKDVFDV